MAWGGGSLSRHSSFPSFQYSILPSFHPSNIPSRSSLEANIGPTDASGRTGPNDYLPVSSFPHILLTTYLPYTPNGNSHASSRQTIRPVKPITTDIPDIYLRVSLSVIPLIWLMIQNPLSFIQGNIFDPQPIAIAR
jgi:hypothetical protein